MSTSANRVRRADNTPSVLLQGRVAPQVKDEIAMAAAASGVSIAFYIEALVNDLVAANGALPLVSAPSRYTTQPELPITPAA